MGQFYAGPSLTLLLLLLLLLTQLPQVLETREYVKAGSTDADKPARRV